MFIGGDGVDSVMLLCKLTTKTVLAYKSALLLIFAIFYAIVAVVISSTCNTKAKERQVIL